MKIFLLAIGTRGDVELFALLGGELVRRGHRVVIGTSSFYFPRCESAGLECVPIGSGSEEQMHGVLRNLAEINEPRGRTEKFINDWVRPQLTQSVKTILFHARGADYFVNALRLRIFRQRQPVPGAFVTYELPDGGGLPHEDRRWPDDGKTIELVALNRSLVDSLHRWPEKYRFTGFWLDPRPTPWTAPQDLQVFLSAGPPPVVVTLGSMAIGDSARMAEAIVQGIQIAGRQAVVLGHLADRRRGVSADGKVWLGGEVPYPWLFPRACCVVHHGGVGTVAAVLAAGVPSVVLPFISAQETFARILSGADLAAAAVASNNVDPENVGAAVRSAVTGQQCRDSAILWRAEMTRDRGCVAAADLIENHLNAPGTIRVNAAP